MALQADSSRGLEVIDKITEQVNSFLDQLTICNSSINPNFYGGLPMHHAS